MTWPGIAYNKIDLSERKSIGLAMLRSLYVIVKGGIAGFMVGVFSVGISIIYPIMILAILLKNRDVISFYS